MRWLQIVRLRVRALLRGSAVDRDLDDEMAAHLDYLIDEYVAQGMSQADAHAKAQREFGGVLQRKEECRDARGVTWITDFGRDVKYGIRMLARTPAFTIASVLTL